MATRGFVDRVYRLLWAGDAAGAEQSVRRQLKASPADAVLWSLLGEVLLRRGRLAEAHAAAEEALRLDPALTRARLCLGDIAMQRGAAAEALECYERAAELSRGTAVLRRLARAYWALGNAEQALAACREGTLFADDVVLYTLAVDILFQQGRTDEAAQVLREARRRRPEDPGLVARLVRLREACVRGLAEVPGAPGADEDGELLLCEAERRLRLGQLAEAALGYRRVLDLQPADAYARRRLGLVLRYLGRLEEALPELQIAFEQAPQDPAIRAALVATYKELGRAAQGAYFFRRYLQRHPEQKSLWSLVRALEREEAISRTD